MSRYPQRFAVTGAGRADTTPADLATWPEVLAAARGGRLERLDVAGRLALVAGLRAVAAAGNAVPVGPGCGLIGATASGSQQANETFASELAVRGSRLVSPHGFAQTLASAATGEVAVAVDTRGPMTTLVGTCAGLQALDLGVRWLQADPELATVLVVGFDVPTSAWEQSRLGAMAAEAGGRLQPSPGRAVGLLLESSASAAARQAPILGYLQGFSEAHGEGAVRRAVEGARGSPPPLRRLDPSPERDAVGPLEELVERLRAPAPRERKNRPWVALARSAHGPVAALAFTGPD